MTARNVENVAHHAALFVLDLLIPDLLPLADEILLGLGTLLFGSWRRSRRLPPEDAT